MNLRSPMKNHLVITIILTIKRKKMVASLLLNVIQSLVVDKASTLAKDHVTKMMEDNLSEDQIKMIDAVVEEMPENSFKSVKDLLG